MRGFGNPAPQGVRVGEGGPAVSRWITGYLDSVLCGVGLILFCDKAHSGLLMLGGFALLLPELGLGVLVGSASAAAMALALTKGRGRGGVYSFNGALCGLAWPYLAPPLHWGFWLLIPAAAFTTALYGMLERFLSPKNLPVLSVPFVVVVWASQAILQPMDVLGPAPVYPHPFFAWGEVAALRPLWEDPLRYASGLLPGAGLLALGLLVYSPVSLLVAAAGAAIGLGLAVAVGGPFGLYWPQLYAFTTAPTALALGGTFVALTRRSVVFALAGVFLSALVWWGLDALLTPMGLLTLTAPFNVATLGLLWVLARRPFFPARAGIHWLPLRSVGRPRLGREGGYPVFAPPGSPEVDPVLSLQRAASLLRRSRRIVALTGAGLSTEAGVPDFAGTAELWSRYGGEGPFTEKRLEEDQAFRRAYWRANGDFFSLIQQAQPHAGHLVLAELERAGRLAGIVTQNVDGLHQRAGNDPDRVVELHGTQYRLRCLSCQALVDREEMTGPPEESRCDACGGRFRIATVNFGEDIPLDALGRAQRLVERADLFLVLGTALEVSPARELPALARGRGVGLIVVNLTETVADPIADVVLHRPAGGALAEILKAEALYAQEVSYRRAVRKDFTPLLARVDEWFGAPVSYLLHPLFFEHFAETSWVAECGGKPVGFLVGFHSQDHPDQAYVHLVAVDPAVRRRGVAHELYRRFEDRVREAGRRRIRLIVVPENRGAIDFHRSQGFRPVEQGVTWTDGLPIMPDYGGPEIHCILFEKRLDS